MALRINWSAEAIYTYENILIYLTDNWSANEVDAFINHTENLLNIIGAQPYAFKASAYKEVRKAVMGKQNSLFYFIKDSEIILLSFWDNRMDPAKNKYDIDR